MFCDEFYSNTAETSLNKKVKVHNNRKFFSGMLKFQVLILCMPDAPAILHNLSDDIHTYRQTDRQTDR